MMSVPLSCLWVILMTIIRSGRVLRPRTAMELQHLTSQLSLVAISWLSPHPCTWGNSWPTDDRCSWHSTGAIVAPIRNSDHFSLSAVISMTQAVGNLRVRSKVFLKHQVKWNTIWGAIRDMSWLNIWLADNTVDVLNEHLSLLVGRYLPIKVIHVRIKELAWLMINEGLAFGLKQEAHLR